MVNKTRIAALLLLPVILLPVAGCARNKVKGDTAYVARDVNTLYSQAKQWSDQALTLVQQRQQQVLAVDLGVTKTQRLGLRVVQCLLPRGDLQPCVVDGLALAQDILFMPLLLGLGDAHSGR